MKSSLLNCVLLLLFSCGCSEPESTPDLTSGLPTEIFAPSEDRDAKVVTLTDSAFEHFQKFLQQNELQPDNYIRVSVELQEDGNYLYKLNFDNTPFSPTDFVDRSGELIVVVDGKSAPFLRGATIDWHEDEEKRGFAFDNPNATGADE